MCLIFTVNLSRQTTCPKKISQDKLVLSIKDTFIKKNIMSSYFIWVLYLRTYFFSKKFKIIDKNKDLWKDIHSVSFQLHNIWTTPSKPFTTAAPFIPIKYKPWLINRWRTRELQDSLERDIVIEVIKRLWVQLPLIKLTINY